MVCWRTPCLFRIAFVYMYFFLPETQPLKMVGFAKFGISESPGGLPFSGAMSVSFREDVSYCI